MSVEEMIILVNEASLGVLPEESSLAPLPEELLAFRTSVGDWILLGYTPNMPFDS